MKVESLAGLLVIAGLLLPVACFASDFDEGARDRADWEQTLASMSEEERAGAVFWAGQRSLPTPIQCEGAPDRRRTGFLAGCQRARFTLDPIDARRHANADYRRGFNTFPLPSSTAAASTPLPSVPLSPPPPPARAAIGDQVTTTRQIGFACMAPTDAAAMGQRMERFSGDLSTMIAEANAYGCYTVGPGSTMKVSDSDADTNTVLVDLPKPLFILGHGKITALWMARWFAQ